LFKQLPEYIIGKAKQEKQHPEPIGRNANHRKYSLYNIAAYTNQEYEQSKTFKKSEKLTFHWSFV
jgi:hypothetical protein